MSLRRAGLIATAAFCLPLLGAAPAPSVASVTVSQAEQDQCAALAAHAPADVRITSAAIAEAGTGWSAGAGPAAGRAPTPVKAAFCRVQGVMEKEMAFELWLPLKAGWNGKFLGAGVGGDAGAFNLRDLPRGVNRGYAAATTDTGHKMTDVNWMLGDPARLTNYEIRANHLLAVKSKEMLGQFYGAPATHAYFIGCSGGGRQGLKELQRFPADYDGIISGAGGPRSPEMTTRRMQEIILRDSKPGLMSPADWKLISETGVRACDELDGVKDGVAEDPRLCHFDVSQLQCQGAKTDQCLTADQVAFARKFYAPLKDKNGRQIDEGLLPGILVDSGRSQLAIGTFGRAIRHRADWNGEDFDAATDLAAIDKVMPELRADQTDLSAFNKRGGKVIFYSGWMDPAVAARMMVTYYEGVQKTAGGGQAAAKFTRLYMAPGMFHCGGGPGPDQMGGSGGDAPIVDPQHDLLSALEAWVEKGDAPKDIIVSKVEQGQVTRTRKLCAYPLQARYKGGDPNQAASFQCAPPPVASKAHGA